MLYTLTMNIKLRLLFHLSTSFNCFSDEMLLGKERKEKTRDVICKGHTFPVIFGVSVALNTIHINAKTLRFCIALDGDFLQYLSNPQHHPSQFFPKISSNLLKNLSAFPIYHRLIHCFFHSISRWRIVKNLFCFTDCEHLI